MGYGDDLMTTGTVRELKLQFPAKKILVGDGRSEYLSPIFWHNPNIDHLAFLKSNNDVIWIQDYTRHRPYLNYQNSTSERQIFVNEFKAQKGDLYFTEAEIQTAKRLVKGLKPFIVVEPNVDSYLGRNKDWGFENWQQLVNQLGSTIRLVQLGNRHAKTLKGVVRIVTENFRAACSILSFAKSFAGTEGALHHAAAALNIPGVVIFGGRISPHMMGYDFHTNLYVDVDGSPCGMIKECDHCKKCMERISVECILESIENQINMEEINESEILIG